MPLTALLLAALTSVFANDRVAVFEGTVDGPREHDAVVVDPAARTARFVLKGSSIETKEKVVVIDLLAPPEVALPNTTGYRDAFDRPGIEKLLENERVTIWRYKWEFGKRTPMHFHARDTVVIFTAKGVLASITPDDKSVLNPHTFGMVKFSVKKRLHQEELVEGEASAVQVELK